MPRTSFAPQETEYQFAERMNLKRQKNMELQRELQAMIDKKAAERRHQRERRIREDDQKALQNLDFQRAEAERREKHKSIDMDLRDDQMRSTEPKKELILLP